MSDLGNELRRIRQKRNLTQEEAAHVAGVSHRTIVSIEDGKIPRLPTLLQITDSLKLPAPVVDTLIVNWVELNLGGYKDRFWIESKNPKEPNLTLHESNTSTAKIIQAVTNLPIRYQEQILKACGRPEILKTLKHLNDLHDKLSGPS